MSESEGGAAVADVDDVAGAILAAAGPMTAKKLEKLVYYAQAWHLAWHQRPLFPETIEAWAQGPVVRHLYDQHRRQYQVRVWASGDADRLSEDERHTVAWVVGKYGPFTAEALSRMTHHDSPWRTARGALAEDARSDRPITHDSMAAFYSRQQADPETAVQLAAASAALEGVELDDDWQATLQDVAAGRVSVEELVRQEIVRGGD
jgi:uncharacterized phage-associated protein